jgi:hypothetical protein
MSHHKRAALAVTAMLGLVLSMLSLGAPAQAGAMLTSTFDTTTLAGTGPQNGTLPNGVNWSVDKGTGPNVQGYYIGINEVQTYTFSQPVSLKFGIAGLNCANEAIRFQPGILPVTINPNHIWNAGTLTVTGNGAGTGDTSTFESAAPVTSFTIQAVGASGCVRGVASFEVGYFDNKTPTATIAAPINGGVFTQGQTVLADYGCADGDTVHVDTVTCVGDVVDGQYIDTATTGAKTFSVIATDEHGATSTSTASYTVKDQAGACTAAAVNLPGSLLDLGVANSPTVPCVTKSNKLAEFTASLGLLPFPLSSLSPSVYVKLAEGKSDKTGNTHSATATVSQVKISMPLNSYSLELKNLWSEVSASVPVNCAAGANLTSNVEVGRIVRNGTFVYNTGANKPLSIPIPLLGEIAINRVQKTASRVTADAVVVDLPGNLLDINIGRSLAGVDC